MKNWLHLANWYDKWGYDGFQQAQYKQKFQNICDSDADIFPARHQTKQTPLLLTKVVKEAEEEVDKNTMLFTMVDGKIYNATTGTKSSMRYYVC